MTASLINQLQIAHHGAVDGVTGSCHRLTVPGGDAVLVDCGLFQGAETSSDGAGADRLEIGFPIDNVRALLVTHVHIDHVGRIPYLLAAGFKGPIVCREATARPLPMVREYALVQSQPVSPGLRLAPGDQLRLRRFASMTKAAHPSFSHHTFRS